jgi:hypothetical protein
MDIIDREFDFLNERIKHLRIIQFTLIIVSLILFITAQTDRARLLTSAGLQIENIQAQLIKPVISSSAGIQSYNTISKNLSNKQIINVAYGGKVYRYCADASCDNYYHIELNLPRHKFSPSCEIGDMDEYVNLPETPKTINEFRDYYNIRAAKSCIFRIDSFDEEAIVNITGSTYVGIEENDSSYEIYIGAAGSLVPETEHLEEGSFVEAEYHTKAIVAAGEINRPYGYVVPKDLVIILSSVDGYRDNMSGLFEEYNDLIIPLEYSRQNPHGEAFLRHHGWAQRSFESEFKALYNVTKDWGYVTIDSAHSVISSELSNQTREIPILGMTVYSNWLTIWGAFLIVGIQYYFLIHFDDLRKSLNTNSVSIDLPIFPWVSISPSIVGNVLLILSVAVIPLIAVISLLLSRLQEVSLFQISAVWQPATGTLVSALLASITLKYGNDVRLQLIATDKDTCDDS